MDCVYAEDEFIEPSPSQILGLIGSSTILTKRLSDEAGLHSRSAPFLRKGLTSVRISTVKRRTYFRLIDHVHVNDPNIPVIRRFLPELPVGGTRYGRA